jgi:hypothetical protein
MMLDDGDATWDTSTPACLDRILRLHGAEIATGRRWQISNEARIRQLERLVAELATGVHRCAEGLQALEARIRVLEVRTRPVRIPLEDGHRK